MKQTLTKSFVLASILVLSACDKGGSDGNKTAAVPGNRVFATGSQTAYCDVASGTLTCYNTPYTGAAQCVSDVITYGSTLELCQKLETIRNSNPVYGSCDVRLAAQAVYDSNSCATVLGQNNGGGYPNQPGYPQPGYPGGGNSSVVNCTLESLNQWGPGLVFNQSIQVNRYGQNQVYNLTRFYGSLKGTARLKFAPARYNRGGSDMITVSYEGRVNGRPQRIERSGYAGTPVEVIINNYNGTVGQRITCTAATNFGTYRAVPLNSLYSCEGTSQISGTGVSEDVRFSIPMNRMSANQTYELATNLTATISGDISSGTQMVLTADNVSTESLVSSTAALKAESSFQAAGVNIKCGPR